jgi:hypothetical protein
MVADYGDNREAFWRWLRIAGGNRTRALMIMALDEWRDKKVTPEQEERRELLRRFAVALLSVEWTRPASPRGVWQLAIDQVDAEPSITKEKQ